MSVKKSTKKHMCFLKALCTTPVICKHYLPKLNPEDDLFPPDAAAAKSNPLVGSACTVVAPNDVLLGAPKTFCDFPKLF